MPHPSLPTRFTPTCTNSRNFEPWLLPTGLSGGEDIWLVRFACDKESLCNHIPSYCWRGYFPDGIFQIMWNKFRGIGRQSIYCVRGHLFFFVGTFRARCTVECLVMCFSEKGSRVEKMSFFPSKHPSTISAALSLWCATSEAYTKQQKHHII